MKALKSIITTIALMLVVSSAYAEGLFPFGKMLRNDKQKPITAVVRMIRTDTQGNPTGISNIFTGKVHMMNDGVSACVVIDEFHHSARDAEFDAVVQKLRTVEMFPAGTYTVFISVDGEYKSYSVPNPSQSGILEFGINSAIPIVSTYQVVAKPIDMTDVEAKNINDSVKGTPAVISLSDLVTN